jgi:hypothetical protein
MRWTLWKEGDYVHVEAGEKARVQLQAVQKMSISRCRAEGLEQGR